MKISVSVRSFRAASLFAAVAAVSFGCQPSTGNTNTSRSESNAGVANVSGGTTNANAGTANTSLPTTSVAIETKEPDQYQATVKLKLEATGTDQKTSLPALSAIVARNAVDRRMEFTLPTNGEKIIYLDKNGTNYAILPNRKQYAELNQDSLGFDVRRLLMPEQIVQQVKNMKGFNLVGEENVNGRQVVKYGYQAVANTQTQAGNVETQSFIMIDKETGLPLHSETVSQSQSGGNVQGYNGFRVVTDMTDIQNTVDPALFAVPTDYQKIDSEQIRAQTNLIFNVIATFLTQAMKQAQPPAQQPTNGSSTPTPTN